MNVTDLMHSYFGDEAARHLGAAAGLDERAAGRVLALGIPLHLDALADQAGRADGQALLGEALDNLPQFHSVAAALIEPGGTERLRQAGEVLAPVLLGTQGGRIVEAAAAASGGAPDRVAQLLHLALPLLLSFLGQRAGAGGLGPLLSSLRGGGLGAPPDAGTSSVSGLFSAAGLVSENRPLSPSGLLDLCQAQFGGQNAERIGVAAGFVQGGQWATLAALPLILDALVHHGRTETGAAEVLNMARGFEALSGAGGQLQLGVLDDSAALGQIEAQGRGLLGILLSDVNELTGRLGTALGGSATSATRLLALLLPLVLAMLGRRAQEGRLDAAGLSRLLGDLSGSLAGLLPAGLSGLSALLGRARVPSAPAPTLPITPLPRATPAVASFSTATATTARRRRGLPWWLLPLLLLLLGGCWLVRPKVPATSTLTPQSTTPAGQGLTVRGPQPGGTLPASAFSIRGTAAPGAAVTLREQGREVSAVSADPQGDWSADLPAPAPGEHTYTVEAKGERTELRINVTGDRAASPSSATPETGSTTNTGSGENSRPETASDGMDPTGNGAGNGASATTEPTPADAGSTASADAQATDTTSAGPSLTGTSAGAPAGSAASVPDRFVITAPAAGATLPAGSFELRGTGTAGEQAELFEDGTSLGAVKVGGDGAWHLQVPTPAPGAHTYTLRGTGGTRRGRLAVTISQPDAKASASPCDQAYSLSITDGQTVTEPFRFGGVGQGKGYTVTVRRGERIIGSKNIPLDTTCGWSYQSKPGRGTIRYEVRPSGVKGAKPLSTVNLTVAR